MVLICVAALCRSAGAQPGKRLPRRRHWGRQCRNAFPASSLNFSLARSCIFSPRSRVPSSEGSYTSTCPWPCSW